MRATKDGVAVVDSERVRLVYRTGSLPRFELKARRLVDLRTEPLREV